MVFAQDELETLRGRLADSRSQRVVAVSHCLLNENARYLGGAFRKDTVREVIDGLQSSGVGIYQMPCPEQRAWGGVLRPQMLAAYGSKGTLRYRLRRPLIWLFLARCRFAYWRLARQVISDLLDYLHSGTEVVAIVGVSSSPTCGVLLTTDVARSVDVLAGCELNTLDPRTLNEDLLGVAVKRGQGYYTRALQRGLARRGVIVPFVEHDYLAEMRGEVVAPLHLDTGQGAQDTYR